MFKENKADVILSFAAFFQIAVLMLQELLISSNIVTHEYFRNVSLVLSAIPMVPATYILIKRRFLLFFITYSIILSLILLTLIFYPDNEKYLIPGTFYLLFINVPCFLCLASIRDIAILNRIMLLLSYIIFALGIIYLFLLWIGSIVFLNYSMSFSYYLLLPALVFVSQRNILSTLIFIIICIIMLMLGSRGALVAAIIYAFSLLFIDRKNRNNILLVTILMTIVIVSGSFFYLFIKLSDNMAVTSRTLNLLLDSDIAHDSSRLDIYSKIWNSILNSPYWGYGIYGDRVLLNGDYCHNIFLEMFHGFGLFFGVGLILLLSFVITRVFFTSDNENKKLLLMFFCYSFIPLLVSGSYLDNAVFGLFIGSLFLLSKNTFVEPIL
jgi:O-antigen ligase